MTKYIYEVDNFTENIGRIPADSHRIEGGVLSLSKLENGYSEFICAYKSWKTVKRVVNNG